MQDRVATRRRLARALSGTVFQYKYKGESITMAKEPILEIQGIHKRFPGVVALKNVGIRLFSGEVHALMGQNGQESRH